MPIVLRHNEMLEMNLVVYRGAVSPTELEDVAAYLAANPSFLKRDTLNIVTETATFDAVPLDKLDTLFGRYRTLYAPLDFQMLRRSAWVCFSPAAQAHVDHWSGKREAREAMSTTLRQFASFQEAGDWLVLSAAETVALQTGAGFDLVATIEDTPDAAPSRGR